jgi:protein CMS1
MAPSRHPLGKRKRETAPSASNKRASNPEKRADTRASADPRFRAAGQVNEDVGLMNSQLLADLVAQSIRRFEPDLSLVELEDRYIPGK